MSSTPTGRLRVLLSAFLPARTRVHARERLRACAGALFGILLTGGLSAWFLGPQAAVTLIAPLGASSVLLFAVPASPLAQPWALMGGNLVSAAVGVTCFLWLPASLPLAATASVAIFFSIFAMFALRCVHPPSGAVALTAVLGGPVIHSMGLSFVLVPVGLNSLLLLLAALLYNKLSGRRYPHQQQLVEPHVPGAPALERLHFKLSDVQQALDEYEQVLAVSADELVELFQRTEALAHARRLAAIQARHA